MWEVESGVIGGLFVGTGLAFVWKLKSAWVVILLAAVAGGLGGVVCKLFLNPTSSDMSFLFECWQGIVLLGIGVAVQINSNKSSIKQWICLTRLTTRQRHPRELKTVDIFVKEVHGAGGVFAVSLTHTT